MQRHDENKDLRSVARVCRISLWDKTIKCSDKSKIGIHTWGKIDYLVNYCGYHFIYDKSVGSGMDKVTETIVHPRDAKKAAKEHKLTDKTKRRK